MTTTTNFSIIPSSLSSDLWAVGLLNFEAKGTPDGFFFPVEGNRRIFICDGGVSNAEYDILWGCTGPDTEALDDEARASLMAYNASVTGRDDLGLKEGYTWQEAYDGLEASGFKPEMDFAWVGGGYDGELWLCPVGADCYDDKEDEASTYQAILDEAVRRYEGGK